MHASIFFRFCLRLLLLLLLTPILVAPAHAQEQDTTAVADSLLLRELEAEMAQMSPPDPPTQAVPRTRPSTNPDISVIGDIRAWYLSEGDRNVDAEFHEAEIAFKSVVDPYARADVYVAVGQEDGEFGFELEEAYLTTLSLPFRLQARAGKFRSTFGKINRLHPHALPFIDTPAVYANFLGDEGLNDQGVGLSWLTPNPSFYQELTLEVTRGPAEGESFVVNDGNRLLYTSHLKNFWDLSENTTLEIGLSGAAGPNDTGRTTLLGGVDVTYRWKPIQFNTYHAFTLQAEALLSRRKLPGNEQVDAWGFYALANYQLARRWFLIGRYDYTDLPDDDAWNENAFAVFLGWSATEFQKLEFGAKTASRPGFDRTYQGLVRLIFVIGTHGAHEY